MGEAKAGEGWRDGAPGRRSLEVWGWRLGLRARAGRRKARRGEQERRLTPGLPSALQAREGGAGPGKIWVLGLPRHCPNWLGQELGQEVRVLAQAEEGGGAADESLGEGGVGVTLLAKVTARKGEHCRVCK